jgi:S1-C subfamily serine protease
MSDIASPLQVFSASLAGLVAGAAPGLVSVHSQRARSSGFAWRPRLIVTADEALADEGDIAVTLADGTTHPATLAGRDASTDIALLRIDRTDLPPLGAPAAPAAPGALALVLGAEDGAPAVALGVIARAAGPWRSLRGGDIDARIELDAAPRRAAEGGLVVDAAGGAIGMAVFGPRRRVLVIPAATIARVATALAAHGRVARGYLGLALQPVPVEGGGGGVMVISVDPQGPGAVAGLLQGDVILAWAGEPVRSVRALLRTLGPDAIGRTVALSVRRAGAPAELALTVGERPPV